MTQSAPHKFFMIIPILLGILTQIQIPLIAHDDNKLGLMINGSDLLLPFLGIYILYALVTGKATFPKWNCRVVHFTMIALTFCFFGTALISYGNLQYFTFWTLTNRLIGWGVLLSIFYASGWLSTNIANDIRGKFFKFFCYGTLAISVINATLLILDESNILQLSFINYPLSGLMVNRNGFAFIFLCAFSIIMVHEKMNRPILKQTYFKLFIFILPLVFVLNGSRSLFILLPLLGFFFFAMQPKKIIKTTYLPLCLGIICALLIPHINHKPLLREGQQSRVNILEYVKPEAQQKGNIHASDNARGIILHDAIKSFKSSPIIGIGLGTFIEEQKRNHGQLIDLIDSIPLWVLTEMGLVGFVIFGSAGFFIVRAIWKNYKSATDDQKVFYASVLMIIFVFCVMGTFHQLFYNRFIWWTLGFAAAVPLTRTSPPHVQTTTPIEN